MTCGHGHVKSNNNASIMTQTASAGTLYAKIGGICFVLGAGMEFFMIKTGFYEK